MNEPFPFSPYPVNQPQSRLAGFHSVKGIGVTPIVLIGLFAVLGVGLVGADVDPGPHPRGIRAGDQGRGSRVHCRDPLRLPRHRHHLLDLAVVGAATPS
jgi:hypothetical protein